MKRILYTIALIVISQIVYGSIKSTDILLKELDQAINDRQLYDSIKKSRIDSIKGTLKQMPLSHEERLHTLWQIIDEYASYNCDSAMYYTDLAINQAQLTHHSEQIHQSMLKKVAILAAIGLYGEAFDILNQIPRHQLSKDNLINYYTNLANIYLFQAEYATHPLYIQKYIGYLNTYRDSLVQVSPMNQLSYVNNKASLLLEQGRIDEAEQLLLSSLNKLASNDRDYAILSSTLAFAYHTCGKQEQEKEMRIKSAIADIKASVKENYSLCALAEILYTEGDIKRANDYIRISMEDAEYYKTPLRQLQISHILPLITEAYQQEKDYQQQKLTIMNVAITLCLLILLLAIARIIIQMRKLSASRKEVVKANKKLQQLNMQLQRLNEDLTQANIRQQNSNLSLREANRIKEEYLGKFLNQCSAYIDKLDEYRRILNRQASAGKMEDLFKTLKSNRIINEELQTFYRSFDASFLRIFPHFVEEFNKLLPKEEKQTPKEGELLTTELRIYALIRLGITDSARIASFLRYSITTIYTYRSKIKNRSLHKEDFEDRIMQISSL